MNNETRLHLIRRRPAVFVVVCAMLVVVSCGGAIWLLSSNADPTYSIEITSIEIDKWGQVTLEYESLCRSGTRERIVLDGMEYGGGSAGGLWWGPVEGSGTIHFDVNEPHQEGTVEKWTERVLVESGRVYERTEGQALDLYRFQADGEERHGYILVE